MKRAVIVTPVEFKKANPGMGLPKNLGQSTGIDSTAASKAARRQDKMTSRALGVPRARATR